MGTEAVNQFLSPRHIVHIVPIYPSFNTFINFYTFLSALLLVRPCLVHIYRIGRLLSRTADLTASTSLHYLIVLVLLGRLDFTPHHNMILTSPVH